MCLKRYHDIQISPSGVWRILKRLDMSRLPSSQRYRRRVDRWKRSEKPLPGHRVQIYVKFIAPLKGSRKKHYQFTAIDDCTRIRVLRIHDRLNQMIAIRFVDYVLEKLPFGVEVIQTAGPVRGSSVARPTHRRGNVSGAGEAAALRDRLCGDRIVSGRTALHDHCRPRG